MSKLHISVAAETLTSIGPVPITNSLLTGFVVSFILLFLGIFINKRKKIPIVIETIVEGFYNLVYSIAGENTDRFFPFLFTFFLFIILGNWIGLLPGVGSVGIWENIGHEKVLVPLFRGPNADLNTTISLALFSVGITQYYSIKFLGLKGYLSKFINIKNPINFFVGLLEAVSEVSKTLSFSFRLFGNIFAGEVLLSVMVFLVPVFIPIPFLILEIFVGFIQALVFTMLTLIFIVVATEKHDKKEVTS